MAVFTSEVFSVGTIGRDVRQRFRGGALRALPDAGRRRALRRRYAVAIHAMATGRHGRGVFRRVIRVIRKRWGAYACGHGPKFAVRSRPFEYSAVTVCHDPGVDVMLF